MMIVVHLILLNLLVLLGLLLAIPFLLGVGGGLLLGSASALRSLKELCTKAHQVRRKAGAIGPVPSLPSHKIYPLGPGWRILRFTVRDLLVHSQIIAARWIDHAASIRSLASEHSWFGKSAVWLLVAGFHLAARLQYLPHLVLALLFLTLSSLFLLTWLFLALLGMNALMVVRLCYVKAGGIRYHCPACYKQMAMPTYLCPTCQAEHTRLRPGIFGVLFHRCATCSTALPTLDWLGRKRLARICPSCHCALGNDLGTGPETHVALVSGRGTPKTLYLLAALLALKQYAPNRFKITFADTAQEQAFTKELRRLRAKQPPAGTSSLVPLAWTLKMQLPRRWLPRLLYLYDPAEEVFKNSTNASQQGYYAFTDGILFVLDSLSLSPLPQSHQAATSEKSVLSSFASTEVMSVYERMMQAFETLAGLSPKRRYPQPVAVVLTGLQGNTHGSERPGTQESSASLSEPANHHALRELLCASGLDTFVRDLESHFAHVQYFSSDVPESSPEQEDSCVAERLLHPLLWLCRLAQR